MIAKDIKRRKLIIKRLLLAFISSIITLILSILIIEFILSKYYYSNVSYITDKIFDEKLGWLMKPGIYTVKPPNSFKMHNIYISKLGIRNDELVKNNKNRIIVLGDSFTYGKTVDNNILFTSQLENILNKNNKSIEYEVINAGIPGYGNAQQLLLLNKLTKENITGEIYILCLFTNDILDNLCRDYGTLSEHNFQPRFIINDNGDLILRDLPMNNILPDDGTFTSVRKEQNKWYTLSVLKSNIESYVQTKPGLIKLLLKFGIDIPCPRIPGVINAWYKDEILLEGIPLMTAILKEMNKEIQSVGGKLFVCMIPSPIQIYIDTYGSLLINSFPNNNQIGRFINKPNKPQEYVKNICDELRIPFNDLYEVFNNRKNESLYVPRDGHFSNVGHKVTAECIHKFIDKDVK